MMLIGAKVMNVYTIVHHAKCKMQQRGRERVSEKPEGGRSQKAKSTRRRRERSGGRARRRLLQP